MIFELVFVKVGVEVVDNILNILVLSMLVVIIFLLSIMVIVYGLVIINVIFRVMCLVVEDVII